MSRRLIIRPEAEADLEDAYSWYETQVPGLGAEFVHTLDIALTDILGNPEQFPRVHQDVRRALTRRFPYQVFYISDDERIVVLAVFHAKRDPVRWKERT